MGGSISKRGRRRFLYYRKGMEDKLTFYIWEMIAIAMVAIILILAVKGIANNTTYWKKYHSADLALMTDLALTDQGDFNIQYNLKEFHNNFITDLIGVEEPKFQTFLKDGSYQVYGYSADKDRFPQSFVFGKNPDVNIVESSASKEYLILKKSQDTLTMESDDTVVSCPALQTTKDVKSIRFDAVSLDDSTQSYTRYINTLLHAYGPEDADKGLLLAFAQGDSTTIYYDTDHTLQSSKMACIIGKELRVKYPSQDIKYQAYDMLDESLDNIGKFRDIQGDYEYWIIIHLGKTDGNSSITQEDLGEAIENAIKEYYG